jgi:origin recognition complex subunit 3
VASNLAEREDKCPFPVLLDGKEGLETVVLRYQTYNKLWEEQERRTNVGPPYGTVQQDF